MANPVTCGDLLFEEYCLLNGYTYERDVDWRVAFGVQTAKAPDYLIDRVGDRAIVEVKHFQTRTRKDKLLQNPGQAIRVSGRDLYGSLRRSIRDAAQQLAPFARLGVPLIVAVANPSRSDVSLDPTDVVSALFGEVTWRIDTSADMRIQPVYGEDGLVIERTADGGLTNRIPHVAAIVALTGGHPAAPRADIYDLAQAPAFAGTPVPPRVFDESTDARFGFVEPDLFARLG